MLPALHMLFKRYILPLHYRTFCHFYRTSTALFGKITGAVPHLFARKTAPKHGPCRVEGYIKAEARGRGAD